MPQFRQVNVTNTTMKIHHHTPAEWQAENEVLAIGEFGLEDGTFLLKIGDGVTHWNHLKYLNKLDPSYFTYLNDGTVTFSQAFQNLVDGMVQKNNAVVPALTITNNPTNPSDAVTKLYVDQAIASAGVLIHKVVDELPDESEANVNVIYMVQDDEGDYQQYMIVDGEYVSLGSMSFELQPGTAAVLGGVRSSNQPNYVYITQQGFMTLNKVSTSLLYVPEGDKLTLRSGGAQEV